MKHLFLIYIVLCVGLSFSQRSDEVILQAGGNRAVEKAYRITEQPKIIDTILPSPVLEYPLLAVKHESQIQLDPIAPASIKTVDKLNQLYSTYVKLGIGSQIMPLGELYFNNKRTRKYQYGVHAKHLSFFGKIKDYAPAQFDRTKVNAFGGINEEKYTLKADLNYQNRGLHYYGLRVPADSISKDSIAQRFQEVGGSFKFASHQEDSAHLNYQIRLDYTYFTSKKPENSDLAKRRVQENYFSLSGKGMYQYGSELFSLDLGVKYNGYQYGFTDTTVSKLDTALKLNNTIIHLFPSVETTLWKNKFKAVLGVNLVLDVHEKTKFHAYPMIEVKYSFFKDLFIPFVGIRGGLTQNSFRTLSYVNEFITQQQILQNQNTAIEVYGGFKGTLSKRISFNINGSFGRVQNLGMFINDTVYARGNQFRMIYDTASVSHLEGSISYQLDEKWKIDVLAKYHSYQMKNESFAWNLPSFESNVRGSYNLYDKFIFNLDLTFQGGRRALVYDSISSDHYENLQYSKKLGFLADVNLGIEYRYNKRISAFLQGNNLIAQRYKRWYNYPVQGIQVIGGITFRF